jgi:hypothetical protein
MKYKCKIFFLILVFSSNDYSVIIFCFFRKKKHFEIFQNAFKLLKIKYYKVSTLFKS